VRPITSFRTSTLPWLDDPSGYEDWATINDSCALNTLNEQALSGRIAALHDTVAQQMGVGYDGIYYHLWGNMHPHVAERAPWLSRPRGMEFRPLLEGISQTATAPVSFWRRFLVLSPGLEFVMLGNASLELRIPNGWVARRVTRTVLS
jgi:hypothetical protein